jgi:UDPglucose 6-dehydrogenase
MKKIGFIGLGKLGMPCAEAFATKYVTSGYDVASVTSDTVTVKDNIKDVVESSDIIFIAVPTPHDPKYDGSQPISHLENKDFDYSIVIDVCKEVNEHATKQQLVVLISTVLPGTTRKNFVNLLSNTRFIYNPYLIAMGSVAWDMVNPEMVIIGTEDGSETTDAKELIDVYKEIMQNDPRYVVGTWDEAEAIKIFYNTFISAKIGLVNMIQDVAEKSGNINVDVVTDALKHSTMRITGHKYLTAGMGDAGPCHPRDNIALRCMAQELGLNYDLFDAIMSAREIQAKNIATRLCRLAGEYNLPIYIHGKAYKPNVPYVDGSYSLLIGHYVENEYKDDVTYIDPLTEDSNPDSVCGVVLLAHNQTVTYGYAGVTEEQKLYCEIEDGSVVVDPWRTYTTDNPKIMVVHYGNSRNRKF